MSVSWQRGRDLVKFYQLSLEQQIAAGGCSLAVKDEELWRRVEELLTDGDPLEIHCPGLDPLAVMEESLKAAASGGRRPQQRGGGARGGGGGARGGLRGLDKAFEVLEQVALNVYLAPWREEYRVIKMYSGLFTHHIAPVLSPPQIQQLFGLLGYQISTSRPEELLLEPSRIRRLLDELLPLSCAFFLARCECRLLLAALGKHDGDVQWQLSLVRERQRGSSLQVAMETTQRSLEPLTEALDVDEDLYGDGQLNGDGMQQTVAVDDAGPHSVTWTTQSCTATPPGAKTNGVTTSSPPEPEASWRPGRRLDGSESPLVETPEIERLCSCLELPHLCLKRCIECNALHDVACTSLDVCYQRGHEVTFIVNEAKEPTAASPHTPSPAAMSSLTLRNDDNLVERLCSCLETPHLCLKRCTECNALHDVACASLDVCYQRGHEVKFIVNEAKEPNAASPAAMSSLTLRDDDLDAAGPALQPIGFHECCDLAKLDPQVFCRSCRVFHSGSCRDKDVCQISHDVRMMGMCSCGKFCSRKPLVLCRYCGNEYCNPCWYRQPLSCICGQTFDQSTSV